MVPVDLEIVDGLRASLDQTCYLCYSNYQGGEMFSIKDQLVSSSGL